MGAKKSKRKYKKLSFKLSYSEYEFLKKCAQLEKMTINKVVKKYLRNGFDEIRLRVLEWEKQKQPKNQLFLFNEEEKIEQISMLGEQEFLYDSKPKK